MFGNRHFSTFIPGHANRTIGKAHGMIIELRKKKTEILDSAGGLGNSGQLKIQIIDEQIKQWEEVIKFWSGKLDPSRNKWFWSILVPATIAFIVSNNFFL